LHFRLSQTKFLLLQQCPSFLQASPFFPPQLRLYWQVGLVAELQMSPRRQSPLSSQESPLKPVSEVLTSWPRATRPTALMPSTARVLPAAALNIVRRLV
jgi:hypothetical protein